MDTAVKVGLALTPVAPERIHDWWEYVSSDLEHCRHHDREDAWLEDIYCAIKTGQAFLYVGLIDGQYAGMTVLQRCVDRFSGEPWLHIWYLHSREHKRSILIEGMAQIEEMARNIGANRVTFTADRAVYERWAKPLGFELQSIEMVRELDHG